MVSSLFLSEVLLFAEMGMRRGVLFVDIFMGPSGGFVNSLV